MKLTKYKYVIVMILTMTFIGQALAAVSSPCAMMETGSSDMMQMEDMDHSHHAIHDPADTERPISDCCEDMTCPMSNCVGSVSINGTTGVYDSMPYNNVLNAEYTVSYLTPALHSLFRPPILR